MYIMSYIGFINGEFIIFSTCHSLVPSLGLSLPKTDSAELELKY